MSKTPNGVKVTIMGRDFSVACQEDQRSALTEAAAYLDKKMREIQKSGKIIGAEKCAIMAALNITHELLTSKAHDGETDKIGTKVFDLLEKIDVVMQEQKQLSI